MTKLNWGVIGLGNIAQIFCESFNDTSNANLLGISSRNNEKLEKFKKKFNIDKKYCFDEYEKLLKCKEIDIIYIALPTSFHYEWIIKCIEAKKNILVEKPAVLNFEQMKNIYNKMIKTDLFFYEAFAYRFHPKIKRVIELINEDTIGKVHSMETVFGQNLMTKKKFFFFEKKKKIDPHNRLFNKNLGGGVILDLGCYPTSLSLLIASLDDNIDLNDVELTNIKKSFFNKDVEVETSLNLNFNKIFNVQIHTSFKKNLGASTKIIGDKGSLIIEDTWTGNSGLIKVNGDQSYFDEIKVDKDFYSYQLEKISESCLKKNQELSYPGISINETLLNMKIISEWINA